LVLVVGWGRREALTQSGTRFVGPEVHKNYSAKLDPFLSGRRGYLLMEKTKGGSRKNPGKLLSSPSVLIEVLKKT